MGDCIFPNTAKGSQCVNCGWELPRDFPVMPRKNCGRKREQCPHLGPPIEREGVTVKVKCGCNGREHDHPHAAHECGLYNRCLPTLRPADAAAWRERKPESDIYHLCHGCDRGRTAEN